MKALLLGIFTLVMLSFPLSSAHAESVSYSSAKLANGGWAFFIRPTYSQALASVNQVLGSGSKNGQFGGTYNPNVVQSTIVTCTGAFHSYYIYRQFYGTYSPVNAYQWAVNSYDYYYQRFGLAGCLFQVN